MFPSPQGWLNITTIDGGSLTSSKIGSDLAQLILSDSGKDQYLQAGDFGLHDHALAPVHINDPRAVELNISGGLEGIYVVAAERAEISVGGDMINCRFDGQNLHAGDVTSINVAGAIENRSEFTSLAVSTAPDFTTLANVYPPLTGSLANLANLFYYDSATKTLTFQGRMTTAQLQALLNLTVQEYDANGQPVIDSSGNPVTVPAQFVSAATLQSLYAASQNIPSDPDSGFRIGGGGAFHVTAASLDLGATAGIVSEGPAENSALANYSTHSADIDVLLAGDLDMFSTTISCLNGGNISVVAGGNVNLGSTYFTGSDQYARGIFSTCDSDVTVVAGGHININGSRIAAYDGGNVTVESLHGSVEVGAGGLGSAAVEEVYVNPVSRAISSYTTTIPGSGILATTFPISLEPGFPSSRNNIGNILVETPQGDITSKSAGIVQIPLNGSSSQAGSVTLVAGTEGSGGKVFYTGNIDVSGGGVIGANVQLEATGSIKGTIVARNNLNISALQNISVSAFANGDLTVNAGETVSGTLIGIDGINVSADTIAAALLSQNISASGNVTSSQIGFSAGTATNATSQSESMDSVTKTAVLADDAGGRTGPAPWPGWQTAAQTIHRARHRFAALIKHRRHPHIMSIAFIHPLFASSALQFAFNKATTEGKVTIGALVLLSFFSWTVIINKTRQLYLATKSNRRFLASYDATTDPMELRRAGRQFENAPVFQLYGRTADELERLLAAAPAPSQGVKRIRAADFEVVKATLEEAAAVEAIG